VQVDPSRKRQFFPENRVTTMPTTFDLPPSTPLPGPATPARWLTAARAWLESAAHAIAIVDSRDQHIVEFNSAFSSLFGEDPNSLRGKALTSLQDASWRHSRLPEICRLALEADEGDAWELLRQHVPGRGVVQLRCRASRMHWGRRSTPFTLLAIQDATPEVACQNRLETAEERVYAVLAASLDAVLLIDGNGRIKHANPSAERMFGYSLEELIGESVTMLMPDAIRPHAGKMLAAMDDPGRSQVMGAGRDVEGCRKDGAVFPMFLCVREVGWRGCRRLLATMRDRTDSRRRDARLLASESLARAILDSTVDAIVTVSSRGIVKTANRATSRIFGYSREEIVGEPLGMLIPELDLRRLAELATSTTARFDGMIATELKARRKDGTTFPLGLSARELQCTDPHSFSCILRDATGAKRSEERIAAFHREIEEGRQQLLTQARQLDEHATRLRHEQERSDASNRAKSEFLANMSHEIRTPMTAILGYADMLAESITDPEHLGALQAMQRNGDHLLSLINGILDLSKIEAGQMAITKVSCSPLRIVREVLQLMSVRCEGKPVDLTLTPSTMVPFSAVTDPMRLRQVLINLVGNAIKFTERGRVTVTVELGPTSPSRRLLQFRVEDTGIGMNSEQLARIFQPFQQADASTTRKYGGSGLGLAISRRIVEMLGGRIQVASELGRGSCFAFSIDPGDLTGVPLEPSDGMFDAETPSPVVNPAPSLTGLRVLLAEDGPDNQLLIRRILERAGADVTVVANGAEAVRACGVETANARTDLFDVILMDMQMPVMDGYEATRILRADGYEGPVIAVTAHAMVGDQQRCLDAGCSSYLTKPIDRRAMLAALAAISRPMAKPVAKPAWESLPTSREELHTDMNGEETPR
jgi:two-component system CheB/CheR fusion protein